jgi:uncharacterized membrane protein
VDAVTPPQRVTQAVGESRVAERVADVQESLYGPLIDWAKNGPLRSDVLGHSLHPLLTDLPVGCWTSATILDLAGGVESRRAATLLVGVGILAAMPTAISGAGDWGWLTGSDRRIGAVHALGADLAIFLFICSFVARLRGRRATATKLALAGNSTIAGAGFFGGHLALGRGTARRR